MNDHHRVPAYRRLEVGDILAPAYKRRGLMTEAMQGFLGHCFGALEEDWLRRAERPIIRP